MRCQGLGLRRVAELERAFSRYQLYERRLPDWTVRLAFRCCGHLQRRWCTSSLYRVQREAPLSSRAPLQPRPVTLNTLDRPH